MLNYSNGIIEIEIEYLENNKKLIQIKVVNFEDILKELENIDTMELKRIKEYDRKRYKKRGDNSR